MLLATLIMAIVFMLMFAVENHLKAKRFREKRLTAISERISKLEEKRGANQLNKNNE